MDKNVRPGFISIDDAIALIEKDTRKDPVVDVDFLLNNLPYLQVDHNYNIKLLKRDASGAIVDNGCTFVEITTDWEKAQLEHAITEHYKQATGREVDPKEIGIKHLTTEMDDSLTGAEHIRVNKKPMIKVGEKVSGGHKEVKE